MRKAHTRDPQPKPGAIGRTVGTFIAGILDRIEKSTEENTIQITDQQLELAEQEERIGDLEHAMKRLEIQIEILEMAQPVNDGSDQ
jgi:hypothetical protein